MSESDVEVTNAIAVFDAGQGLIIATVPHENKAAVADSSEGGV
jgi:hypothetical protein